MLSVSHDLARGGDWALLQMAMNAISGMNAQLFERDMHGLDDILHASLLATPMGRCRRMAILKLDDKVQASEANHVDQQDASIRAHFDEAEKMLILPEGKAKLAEARATYAEYLASTREVLRLTRAQNQKAALDLENSKTKVLGDQLDKELEQLVAIKQGVGKKTYEAGLEVFSRSRNTLVVAVAITILLAIG